MRTDERSQHSEELFVDKGTFRPRARAPSPWYITLVLRHESNTRASGLRHDVFIRIRPLKLDSRPSALAAVPFDLGMTRTPERRISRSPEQW